MKSSEEKRQLFWLIKHMSIKEAWIYAIAQKDSDVWIAVCQNIAGIILQEHEANKAALRLMYKTALKHSLQQYPGDKA